MIDLAVYFSLVLPACDGDSRFLLFFLRNKGDGGSSFDPSFFGSGGSPSKLGAFGAESFRRVSGAGERALASGGGSCECGFRLSGHLGHASLGERAAFVWQFVTATIWFFAARLGEVHASYDAIKRFDVEVFRC
jgi:hypothetical protein